jgi:8-oxo-dGTP pyrophosphatase MutT (NUDIX family)
MEKFTKMKAKTNDNDEADDVKYDDGYIKVISYEDWSLVSESDVVVCIIYLVDLNQIVVRQEYIPTFKYRDGQEYHLTLVSGTMEEGETPEETLFREIQEEAGIVIRDDFNIEFMKPLFATKGNLSKYHPAIIQLTERDYTEVVASGDGSEAEQKSKSVKLDVKYLNSLSPSDLITDYMLIKIKD